MAILRRPQPLPFGAAAQSHSANAGSGITPRQSEVNPGGRLKAAPLAGVSQPAPLRRPPVVVPQLDANVSSETTQSATLAATPAILDTPVITPPAVAQPTVAVQAVTVVQHAPPKCEPGSAVQNEALSSRFDYDYLAELERFVHRKSLAVYTERGFERQMGSSLGAKNVAELICSESYANNVYANTILAPGQPQAVVREKRRLLNTYRGPDAKPSEGWTAVFEATFEHLVRDESTRTYLLKHFATLVRHPGQRQGVLLVLKSNNPENLKELQLILQAIVGQRHVLFADEATMALQFNDYLRQALVVILPRMPRTRSALLRVDSLVNSPEILINPKREDAYRIDNLINVVACIKDLAELSGYPDLRDVVVIPISDEPWAGESKRLSEVLAQPQFVSSTLYALRRQPIHDFDARTSPHRPALGLEGERLSMSATESYLREAAEGQLAPMLCDLVVINPLVDFLNKAKSLRTNVSEVRDALVNMGAKNLGQKRINGKKPNVWAHRNLERWEVATEAAISQAYVDPFEQEPSNRAPAKAVRIIVEDVSEDDIEG